MPLGKKSVTILWNSDSGWSHSLETARRVENLLASQGSAVTLRQIQKGDDLIETSRQLVAQGADVLVAAGGDGTVSAVAAALIDSSAALAVIPAGTLNHFARDLTIPLDVESAAQSALSGHEISADVGSVNGHIFINNSVLGLYPIYRAAREAYERRGLTGNRFAHFLAVTRAIFRVLWHLPHLHLQLQMEDGRLIQVQTPFVLIANNEHEVENWNIGHRHSMNKGHLWVYVMRRCTRWAVLRFFASFLLKRFSRGEAFDIYQVKTIAVNSKAAHLRVGIDGEIVRLSTPLVYTSRPQALRVIAPATYVPETALGAGVE